MYYCCTCDFLQQDSEPAHHARQTIELLQRETPKFIRLDLWSPNSPDFNPVDYRVWGVMQDRVYQTPVRDVADLRQRLIDTWNDLSWSIVDDAVDEQHKRLQTCVNEKVGNFEHLLKDFGLSVDWLCG